MKLLQQAVTLFYGALALLSSSLSLSVEASESMATTSPKGSKSDKAPHSTKGSKTPKRWTIADLHDGPAPYAIAHRGFGATDGTGVDIPDIPTENTIESVEAGFEAGARIVEVDVQLTADGNTLVYHDDYLPDFTCINQLTTKELKDLLPEAPTLEKVLKKARKYSKRHKSKRSKSNGPMPEEPSGLVIVEIKTPSPLCDPSDSTEEALVDAVIRDIYEAKMAEQVSISSFSPALLLVAGQLSPEIERVQTMTMAQFLPKETVEAITGLPVTYIDKDVGLGLRWADTGVLFRLPGYDSAEQFLATAGGVGATGVLLDQVFLGQAEQTEAGSAAALVAKLQSFGFYVQTYTARAALEWMFLERIGVNGIITDTVEEGIAMQASWD